MRYFVLLNNYVTLGLQKTRISNKVRDTSFYRTFPAMYGNYIRITLRLGLSIYCIFSMPELCCKCFSYTVIFFMTLGLCSFVGTFALRIEITLKLGFVFVHYYDVFFIASKLCYLFVQCSYVFCRR